jgi:hypothetical protein
VTTKGIFAAIATLLIALSVQNTASARSYAFSRFTRGSPSDVYAAAASAHVLPQHPRTLKEKLSNTQDRNQEGYPRPAD